MTSLTRCSDRMLQKTEEFTEELDPFLASHHMSKNNIIIFDETIIGDDISLPLFIGQRRKSGGGNHNVNEPRHGALDRSVCPMAEHRLEFFIFMTGKLKKR